VLDFRFIGGSMGSVVGEKVARTIELAGSEELPLVVVSASGGARMFEGVYSLMQMAKTSVALSRFVEGSCPYVSILTDPTFGGVTASFATAADVVIAEPGARIGFTGARVIEQTTKERMPEGFQTAEFQRDHGMVDRIVHRLTLKETWSGCWGSCREERAVILDFERPIKDFEERIAELRRLAGPSQELRSEISRLEDALDAARKRIYSNLSPYQRVQVARHPERPNFRDYRDALTDDFYELSGDRFFGDDRRCAAGSPGSATGTTTSSLSVTTRERT
jgi:acetyl-CoA carboxylase carboxyl transferase subunit beta